MSKELKAFNGICCNTNQNYPDFQKQKKIVETALKDYEKKTKLAKEYKDVNNVAKRLKALEIIKEKRVNADYLIESVNLEEYNRHMSYCYGSFLTQEEYDLLKEVLL